MRKTIHAFYQDKVLGKIGLFREKMLSRVGIQSAGFVSQPVLQKLNMTAGLSVRSHTN